MALFKSRTLNSIGFNRR